MPDALTSHRNWLHTIEMAVAIAMSTAAVCLHLVVATSAGALWRDEATTAGLAMLPTVKEVWSNMQFDSFPALWPFFVRLFLSIVGEMNDTAMRVAGLAVGLLLLATIWGAARAFGHRLPIVALALFALAPSVIRWGDSFRAYGLGIALGIGVMASVWRYVDRPTSGSFSLALVLSVASVHTIYFNTTVVFAVCIAAATVLGLRRAWQRIIPVGALGLVSALSLLPYASTFTSVASWKSLVEIRDYTGAWFIIKLGETLDPAGMWSLPLWVGAALLALIAAVREWSMPHRLSLSARDRDVLVYSIVAITAGLAANIMFLDALSYLTQPWYYLTLLAITAIGIDAIAGVLAKQGRVKLGLVGAAAIVAVATVAPAIEGLRIRMTNADIVANVVSNASRPGDLVVISPWYTVVSFTRYYDGSATWVTVPQIPFGRFQRYDILSQHMRSADQSAPVRPVLDAIERTLRQGSMVYIVGGLGNRIGREPLGPARLPDDGWKSPQYQAQWEGMVRAMLDRHSDMVPIPAPSDIPISLYETMSMAAARGWID